MSRLSKAYDFEESDLNYNEVITIISKTNGNMKRTHKENDKTQLLILKLLSQELTRRLNNSILDSKSIWNDL